MVEQQTVSVIIPCADQGQHLATSVASLARQTRPVDEIIIVRPADDGATAVIARQLRLRMLDAVMLHRRIHAGSLSQRSDTRDKGYLKLIQARLHERRNK